MSKPSFEYNPDDHRSFEEQYNDWLIIADTTELDITTYPGRGDEQKSQAHPHAVVTKRNNRG